MKESGRKGRVDEVRVEGSREFIRRMGRMREGGRRVDVMKVE
jgi:hypothetical protein